MVWKILRNHNGAHCYSHDRHFINSIATDIADLDYNVIKVYPGNYDDYMEASNFSTRKQLINDNKRTKEKIADL